MGSNLPLGSVFALPDYLAKAKSAHETDVLEQLHKKYLILQFHSQRNQEPDPKLLELQDVMRSWLKCVSAQQPLSKVSVLSLPIILR